MRVRAPHTKLTVAAMAALDSGAARSEMLRSTSGQGSTSNDSRRRPARVNLRFHARWSEV